MLLTYGQDGTGNDERCVASYAAKPMDKIGGKCGKFAATISITMLGQTTARNATAAAIATAAASVAAAAAIAAAAAAEIEQQHKKLQQQK